MRKVLIVVAVYDTDDNNRTEYTMETYFHLQSTIHYTTQVVFVNNDSCYQTRNFLESICNEQFALINLEDNIGTAEAINRGIKDFYEDGDFVIKMDNDCVVYEKEWETKMRDCIESDSSIGVLGLKRKDLPNSPTSEQYPTELCFTNDELGNVWHVIELCDDIIGTCQMFNPELINKIGYLYQPGLYGFDDVLMCERSRIAGFRNAFYPSIEIDHIDTGESEYTNWKSRYAGTQFGSVNKLIEGYRNGQIPIYYNPFT